MKPKDLNMAVKFKKSNNQNTTVRDRVKLETGKTTKSENICRLNVDGKLTSNHQEIVVTFNIHVLSVAKSINTKKTNHNDSSINNMDNTTPNHYLLQSFKSPFPNTELKLLSTREFKNIVDSQIKEFTWI